MHHHQILRNHFNPLPLEPLLPARGRGVPAWLGDFQFEIYGEGGKNRRSIPYLMREFIDELASLRPSQQFNTVFFQRYNTGASVKLHRDPRNNVGFTVIAILGKFEGARTTLHLESGLTTFRLVAGDVLVLPCTIDGKQGPPHEVSPVLSGTRFAVILNTIETDIDPRVSLLDEVFT